MEEKIVYDPRKKYTWKPEDEFVFGGEEFGLVLNAIRGVLNTPEAAKILLASQANKAVENVFSKAVENGIAVEVNEDEKISRDMVESPLKIVK